MTQITQGLYKTFKAGASLSGKRYYVAALSADNTVILATGPTDVLVGIIQEAVDADDNVPVAMASGGGSSRALAGSTIARGVYLTADSSGKVTQAKDTGDRIIAMALENAVSGDIFEVQMMSARHVAGTSASPSLSPSASASPSLSPSSSESASRSPSASSSPSRSPSASLSPSSSASPS